MKTYFARHTRDLDVDDETLKKVINSNCIAIHFPLTANHDLPPRKDNTSLNPNDYPTNGRKAVRALTELAQEGGYVLATFREHDECLLGFVRPQSTVELLDGRWGTMDREAILKTVQLQKARWMALRDLPHLLAGQPQQGTICQWRLCGDLVRRYVEHDNTPLGLAGLPPFLQETLCAEFLRAPGKGNGLPTLVGLLAPVGRTMKDIDIYGLASDGNRLYAQVTYKRFNEPSARDKFKALRSYSIQDSHCIFFCRTETNGRVDGIHVVSLEKTFDAFGLTALGRRWLSVVGGEQA